MFSLEPITAFQNLPGIIALAASARMGLVFGRVDFAGSLGRDRFFVDGPQMLDCIKQVAGVARERDLDLVGGGGVGHSSIHTLRRIREVRLDRFETRKIVFDGLIEDGRVELALALAMDFELLWLKNKRDYYRPIGTEDDVRITMLDERRTRVSS